MKKFYLREIAHSKSGDKGDTNNVSVIAYDPRDYSLILEQVTAERVKAHFRELVREDVLRYELPNVHALNFVLHKALGGGVTRSLSMDPHGKSYSALILTMEVEIPDDRAAELESKGRHALS